MKETKEGFSAEPQPAGETPECTCAGQIKGQLKKVWTADDACPVHGVAAPAPVHPSQERCTPEMCLLCANREACGCVCHQKAAPVPPQAGDAEAYRYDLLCWAVDKWNAEVLNRPVQNVHRRSLDDTWR